MTTVSEQRESVFQAFAAQAWPYCFHVELLVTELHGGTPRDPNTLRNWLRHKAGYTDELEIEDELKRIFNVADVDQSDQEIAEAATVDLHDRHVNGFKRDKDGIFMEGRHLKACLKEAVSVARAANKLPKKFGETGKGTIAFAAEHIMVPEYKLHLGREEHDELHTRFTKTRFGTGITVEEVVYDAVITATVKCDYDFSEKEWAMIWLTAEEIGIGASRSQGFGKFVVTAWEPR